MPARSFFLLLALRLLPLMAYAAAGDGAKVFDLPTGAAEQRLIELSEQAGVQILFPTDIVQNVQTNAVQGPLSPRAALEKMLAGTTLIVAPEDGRGTLEVRRAAEPEATLVVLPPLSVTSQGTPWRIAETPGFVFLSHCTDAVTRGYMQGLARALRILELLVPPEFLLKADVPHIIILSPQGQSSSVMSHNLLNNFSGAREPPASSAPVNLMDPGALDRLDHIVQAQTTLRIVRDMELIDKDRAVTFTSVREATFEGDKVFIRWEHFEYLLQARRPALPAWVVAGLVKLYGDQRNVLQVEGINLAGLEWLSAYDSKLVGKDAKARAQALMPMEEFLTAPASAQRDAQAALFVRWSLDSWVSARESSYTKSNRAAKGGRAARPNQEAFWKFVARAAAGPVSEAEFQECFGLGFDGMRARLTDYLLDAVRGPVRLRLEKGPGPVWPAMRTATTAEVARIKGDWERLTTGVVKVHQPQYAQSYAFQARATLMQAYRDGVRDPGVLAVLGLFETNLGDDNAARPHLEAAVAGGVVRPQVYYELARIRYAEAQANPAGRNGLLSAAQAAAVTAPLLAGHQQSPPLRECFDLAVVVWSKSDVALTRRELSLLEVGLKAFPHDSDLLYKTALVNAVQGFKAETTKLVERGLKQSRDTDSHARFLDILTKLDPENGMLPVESFRYVERRTPRAAFEAIVWAATIGADSTLTGALALEGDAKQQAELLRIELAARTQRAEYATTDKLAALSYKHLFTGVTGVQILDQAKVGDGPVQLEVRLRRKDDTISNEIFAFQMGVGGWQLLVSDGQMQRLRDQLAEARPAAPAAGAKQKTPDVLVVSDVLAPIPEALRPQPGKPVYYQILGQRENDLGSSIAGEARLEPEVIERDVIRTLAAQGFMQTGPRGPKPALSILIEWGSANLDIDEFTVPATPKPDFGAVADPAAAPEPPPADTEVITTVYNRREIMMLVGADKANMSSLSPQEVEQINDAMRRRRSYVLVGAFETATLAKKQKKLLWRTRMSIDALDQSLPDALGTMLASGAPQFGQNVDRPVFVTERDRQAEVQIGTAVVVPDETPPAPPAKQQ